MTIISDVMLVLRTRANKTHIIKVQSSCTLTGTAKESCIREEFIEDASINSFGDAWTKIILPRLTKIIQIFRASF